MAEAQYADAAGVMDGEVRPAVAEGIGGHEQGLGAPTGEELLGLVDDMVGRLQTVARE